MEDKKGNSGSKSKDKVKKETDTKKDEGLKTAFKNTGKDEIEKVKVDYVDYGDGFPQDDGSKGSAEINQSDISRPFDSGIAVPKEQPQQ